MDDLSTQWAQFASREDIEHFGVKGMKWGVRKKERSGGGGGSATKKTVKATSKSNVQRSRSDKPETEKQAAKANIQEANRSGVRAIAGTKSHNTLYKRNPLADPEANGSWKDAHTLRDVSRMTDAQLSAVNRRLQMEMTYAQLTAGKPGRLDLFKKEAQNALVDVARVQTRKVLNKKVSKLLGTEGGKK